MCLIVYTLQPHRQVGSFSSTPTTTSQLFRLMTLVLMRNRAMASTFVSPMQSIQGSYAHSVSYQSLSAPQVAQRPFCPSTSSIYTLPSVLVLLLVRLVCSSPIPLLYSIYSLPTPYILGGVRPTLLPSKYRPLFLWIVMGICHQQCVSISKPCLLLLRSWFLLGSPLLSRLLISSLPQGIG